MSERFFTIALGIEIAAGLVAVLFGKQIYPAFAEQAAPTSNAELTGDALCYGTDDEWVYQEWPMCVDGDSNILFLPDISGDMPDFTREMFEELFRGLKSQRLREMEKGDTKPRLDHDAVPTVPFWSVPQVYKI